MVLDQPGGDVVLRQHLDDPLGRPVPGVHDGDPPAVGQPARMSTTARSMSPR